MKVTKGIPSKLVLISGMDTGQAFVLRGSLYKKTDSQTLDGRDKIVKLETGYLSHFDSGHMAQTVQYEIDLRGVMIGPPVSFGEINVGDSFLLRGDLHIKTDGGIFQLDGGYVYGLPDTKIVEPIDAEMRYT